MAPRQLLLELEEVEMAAEKGSKRVRVDCADESSTQVRLTHPFPPTLLSGLRSMKGEGDRGLGEIGESEC
eukprot:scaffold3801_cov124-Isochrysis_galbana.AAC.6